ncbi:MAG: undecaprenyl-diphosphate phosphatase [Clostridia bacterium]|nr:undecaprenyl-diphosphate phosphatase [Clostridia bacterium]
MEIWEAIILGIVQGLTEFLPISSSGHLVLLQNIFDTGSNLFMTVALHLGSLVAVVVVFWKDIVYIVKHPFCDLSKKIIFATIPTVIIVLFFKTYIEDSFNGNFFLIGFILTAFLLMITEIIAKKVDFKKPLSTKTAVIMGIAQGIATLPGISRSGSTICAGLLCGEHRDSVASFSFLMSIPIIIASCVYELLFSASSVTVSVLPIIIGMIFAFIFGMLAIKLMLKLIKKVEFTYFAIYLVVLVVVLSLFHIV